MACGGRLMPGGSAGCGTGDDHSDVPPLPEALAALVDQHRADHAVGVTLEHRATTRPVPSGPTVALLSATREALTNAAKHAPGRPVEVQLDFRAEAVRVRPCGSSSPMTNRSSARAWSRC